jgi:hypothetical protein
MQFVEPIILQGINKDVAPNGLDYSGRKIINPLRDALNCRYLSSEGEETFQVESIKGNEEIENTDVYKELTTNSNFEEDIDGWENVNFMSGLAWAYGDDSARITSASALDTNSDIIAEPIDAIPLTNIDIRVAAEAGTFVDGATIIGYFLDSSNNIVESFVIGFVPNGQRRVFIMSKLLPAGVDKVGIAASFVSTGASQLDIGQFKVSGLQELGLPDGLNECIGSYENIEQNLLIFFIWNSNGYHGVFKYDASSENITQILVDDPSDPVLNFSNNPRYAITGIGMIGDILMWTDNLNPQRYINITREYLTRNDFNLSLYKIGPRNKPQINGQGDATIDKNNDFDVKTNRIADNSFQFAFYYVFLDNEQSALSPYSNLVLADAYGADKSFQSYRNVTVVNFTIDQDIKPYIKRVELCFRVGNGPNWIVWKKYEEFGDTISAAFYNDSPGEAVPESQANKLFDSIPNRSKALVIAKGRCFLNIEEEGMEVPELEITPSLSADVDVTTIVTSPAMRAPGIRGFLKKNGMNSVGVVVSDKFGRFTGVYTKAKISGKELLLPEILPWPGNIDAENKKANNLNVALAGSVPPGSRYSIVLNPNSTYEVYLQTPATVHLYVSEAVGDPQPDIYQISNKFYLVKTTAGNHNNYGFIHFYLPDIPIVIDTEFYVRIITKDHKTVVERVLEVIGGNILVTGKFNGLFIDPALVYQDDTEFMSFIEIFKLRTVPDIFYKEVAGPFESGDGSVEPAFEGIEGDTYYRGILSDADEEKIDNNLNYFRFSADAMKDDNGGNSPAYISNTVIETPSPVYKAGGLQTTTITERTGSNFDTIKKTYTSDYSKSAWNGGRAFVEAKPVVLQRPATIRYSDVFIEGSNINGLNSFPVENLYDKIGHDSGPITKFILTGNIMLAIHERNVTSLYLGEAIVTSGEGEFLTQVKDVIGGDRKLIGNFGSYHPESVYEVDGLVFGFDIFNGAVWRYTAEGPYAVSNYGMKNYFRDKARDYFDVKDQLKFVGAIDKYNKEYLISLPHKYATRQVEDLVDLSGSTGFHDIALDPDDYTEGEVYRIKVVGFKQTDTLDDTITVTALLDGTEEVNTGINQILTTYVENDAVAIFIEFLFSGEDFIRVSVTGIAAPIYLRLTTEYQEIKGETWGFNYERNVWTSRFSFVPEFMGKVGNKLFSFKNGRLFKHNVSDTYNNFYGIQYQRNFTIACNPIPNKVKVWSAIQIAAHSIAADEEGALKVLECENDMVTNGNNQSSYTRAKEFEKREGVYYAPILKDVNTNAAMITAGRNALRDGKDMRSKSLELTINNDRTDRSLLQKLNIIGEYSEFSV